MITEPTPSWLQRDWIWALVLVFAVMAAYSPVGWAGYVWDDDAVITANPCVVGPLGLKEIWTTSAADIAPLTISTFWLEHALWGLAPLPYHLVNVLLHGACAVLLWRVLRELRVPGAWLGAALWALHPVQVESVAWITEMKNTESGVFYLLSILCFLRWLKTGDSEEKKGGVWDYGWTLLFAALAMACKSSTVILPVVLLLCAWWQESRWQGRHLRGIAPIFLLAVLAGIVSLWTQGEHLAATPDPQWYRTWPESSATAGDAVWFYLGKLVWPYPLMTVYPRWQPDTGSVISYPPTLAVVIVLVILWLKRDSWARPWFFVFAYFLVALLPVLGFADLYYQRYSLVADHFQYLASMGPLALAGAGLFRLANLVALGKTRLRSSLGSAVLLLLGTMSWQRTWVYQDKETLWTDAVAKNPACWVGYNDLAYLFRNKGQVDRALALLQTALAIYPNYAEAHNNLGNIFDEKGQANEAMAEYQKALELNPNYAQAHYNLGRNLEQKGQLDEAMNQFQMALAIDPYYASAHHNLGNILAQKGQLDEASEQFQAALAFNPNEAATHYNLGRILQQKGQLAEALGEYQKAIELDPDYAESHNNLGDILARAGRIDEAIDHYRKALANDPNFADAHSNLGACLFQKGQLDEAIDQYQKALAINSTNAGARSNLGLALFQKGRRDEEIDHYQNALAINPTLTNAHTNLGIALMQKGQLSEAIDQFQAAVQLNPNDGHVKDLLAKAQAMKRQGPSHK